MSQKTQAECSADADKRYIRVCTLIRAGLGVDGCTQYSPTIPAIAEERQFQGDKCVTVCCPDAVKSDSSAIGRVGQTRGIPR